MGLLKLFLPALGLAAGLGLAAPAPASTLPDGAVPPGFAVGGGLGAWVSPGFGGALALDYAVREGLSVGLSAGGTSAGYVAYEARALYRLVEATGMSPAVSVLAGVWGQPGAARFTSGLPFAPELGFALSYRFLERWRAGLNLVYSPFFRYGLERWIFAEGPPGAGLAVGYALTPGLEVTVGLSGYGELVGLRGRF